MPNRFAKICQLFVRIVPMIARPVCIFAGLLLLGNVQGSGHGHKNDTDDRPENPDFRVCQELSGNLDSWTQERLVAGLTDPCRYDKSIKPSSEDAMPIFVQMEITHVESSNQRQFTVYVLVQYEYDDERLKYEELSPNRGKILGETGLRDKIWVPHMVIKDDKDTTIMGMDGKDVFVTITPRGHVLYAYRMIVTFYCWMNLEKFPFDSQECDLRLYSWMYDSDSVLLRWNKDGVRVSPKLHMTEFYMTSVETDEGLTMTQNPLPGNYSELVFIFKMQREIGYYILGYFLPSILLVCTSWVTFWLQADAGPPRATLGTSTILSFITLNLGLVNNLPKVSYVKACDIWFVVCAFFILGSLAEFAFVNVIWRRRKKVELKKPTGKHILRGALTPSLARKQLDQLRKTESAQAVWKPEREVSHKVIAQNYMTIHGYPVAEPNSPDSSVIFFDEGDSNSATIQMGDEKKESPTPTRTLSWYTMNPQEVAIWVDRKSRIVFPVAFIIFNIFYWSFVYIV